MLVSKGDHDVASHCSWEMSRICVSFCKRIFLDEGCRRWVTRWAHQVRQVFINWDICDMWKMIRLLSPFGMVATFGTSIFMVVCRYPFWRCEAGERVSSPERWYEKWRGVKDLSRESIPYGCHTDYCVIKNRLESRALSKWSHRVQVLSGETT